MKSKLILVVSVLTVAIALFSFAAPPSVKYKVDTKQSTLQWTGKKVTGQHHGTIPISAGEFNADGTLIKDGSFEVNVAGLTNTDLTDDESNAKLVRHLKSDDFFGVEKYPTATFTITSVTPKSGNEYTVKGNLTIKGKTNEIEFPAVVTTEGKSIVATAKIPVDRSKYDVRYGSKSFFDNLGNKYIDDEFQLDLKLVGVPNTGA